MTLSYFILWMNMDMENMENGILIGYTIMVVALSLIFFAIKSYRDNQLNGAIKLGKAFLLGLYITLVAGCMYATTWEVYYRNDGSNFMEKYMAKYEKDMRDSGTTEAHITDEINKMKVMAENYKNPVIRFGMTLMEILPVGILISIISALLLKRKVAI
jgi:glucan phosphoethanolaminetransferase (alkaline phosphatase superfamily)